MIDEFNPEEIHVIRCLVLAGGTGTRLMPYTTVLPKPLMPLGTSTILEHLLQGVAKSGISDVTISLGYLGHLVRAVIGDGASVGVSARYTSEPVPLGTAGPIRLLSPIEPEDTVLVVNGDTWTTFDFAEAVREVDDRKADAVVVCTERTTRIDFGVVELDAADSLGRYIEKPVLTHLASTVTCIKDLGQVLS